MVDKVKNLNWPLYSEISLFLANLTALISIIFITLNTKQITNQNLMMYLSLMGLMIYVLLKLNHAVSANGK